MVCIAIATCSYLPDQSSHTDFKSSASVPIADLALPTVEGAALSGRSFHGSTFFVR